MLQHRGLNEGGSPSGLPIILWSVISCSWSPSPMVMGWDWSPWWHTARCSFSRSHLGLLTFTVKVSWAVFNSRVLDPKIRNQEGLRQRPKPIPPKIHFLSAEPSLSILSRWPVGEAVSLWQTGHEQWGPQSNDQLGLSSGVVQGPSEPAPICWLCQSSP